MIPHISSELLCKHTELKLRRRNTESRENRKQMIDEQIQAINKSVDGSSKIYTQVGIKDDSAKMDLTYLFDFKNALEEVCRVARGGDKKYTQLSGKPARGNWLIVPDGFSRYTAALMRHLMASAKEDSDGDMDEWEKGITHDAQVAWNALTRLELRLRKELEEKSNK